MLSLDDYLTTRPHTIRAVFVSDLHLSAHTPSLNTAFIHFINDLVAFPNLQALFILGDFLDAWVGDDDFFCQKQPNPQHWLNPIVNALKNLPCQIYLMHGNRDFMLGKRLCHVMNAKRIHEPYLFEIKNKIYRLEHGDRLCTDDVHYQRYRKIIQNPITKQLLFALPLSVRYKLAGNIQKTSDHQKNNKNQNIMDVNPAAVHQTLSGVDVLIHGHTHRPASHQLDDKQRLVLGDWQFDKKSVQAVIGLGVLDDDDQWAVRLAHLSYDYF